MDHAQLEPGIALLLADRWPHLDAPVAKLDTGLAGLAIIPGDLHAVEALDRNLLHFVRDRVPPIAGQAIDAGAHEEVGAHRLRRAEELVDVVLAVTDMDQSRRVVEERGGLAHILQPADALLALDRHAGRVDLALERVRALELGPCPELDRRQPQRQPLRRHGQAGVHQQAADGMHPELAIGLAPARHCRDHADPLGPRTLERELGRVLQHQDRPLGGGNATMRRVEMAGEDLGLADRCVGQETIGGLGVGPVLACQGKRRADGICYLDEELAQPPAQALVFERRAGEFLVNP